MDKQTFHNSYGCFGVKAVCKQGKYTWNKARSNYIMSKIRMYLINYGLNRANLKSYIKTNFPNYRITGQQSFQIGLIQALQSRQTTGQEIYGIIQELYGGIRKGRNRKDALLRDNAANYRIKVAQNQASQITSDGEKVQNIVAEYINNFQGYFTHYQTGSKTPWLSDFDIATFRGAVAGRYTQENGKVTISIPMAKITAFAMEKGVDKQTLSRWADGQGGTIGNVMLAPKSIITRCLVLPMPDETGVTK